MRLHRLYKVVLLNTLDIHSHNRQPMRYASLVLMIVAVAILLFTGWPLPLVGFLLVLAAILAGVPSRGPSNNHDPLLVKIISLLVMAGGAYTLVSSIGMLKAGGFHGPILLSALFSVVFIVCAIAYWSGKPKADPILQIMLALWALKSLYLPFALSSGSRFSEIFPSLTMPLLLCMLPAAILILLIRNT